MDAKEQVKAKLDVAEVISEYVTLKPAGSGSFKGICPFHAERTPSFHVSRERQIWKCFGCEKGGDVFSFVMEMEGVSFGEALKLLARRAGVELPQYEHKPTDGKEDRLRSMHESATKFYEYILRETTQASRARTYVRERGITDDLLTTFRLGAATSDWDALAKHLQKKGFRDTELVESGLCLRRRSGTGLIDRFRDRLMIPLADANGRVVGFTARVLPGAIGDGPKYMNSPETPIYHKSEILYGLHLAKRAARKSGEIIIVEGNLDVIASYGAGVEQVVASSGTALTEEQLRTLSRYVKRLIFCLDDDAAGFAAAKRVFALAMKLQEEKEFAVELRCLVIPEGAGKDPDEVVQKNPELWRSIALNSQSIIEYYFEKTLRAFDHGKETSVTDRHNLIDTLLPEVARLHRPDEQYLYLLRLSDATHVTVEVLKGMMKEKAPSKPVGEKPSATVKQPPQSKASSAAVFLLGILLKYETLAKEILPYIDEEHIAAPWNALYSEMKILYTPPQTQLAAATEKTPLFLRLRGALESRGETRLVSAIDTLALRIDEMLSGMSPHAVRAEVDRHLILLQEERSKLRRKELERLIRQAEIAGDQVALQQRLLEYSSLLNPSTQGTRGDVL